jgi:hypothetical membrane protein
MNSILDTSNETQIANFITPFVNNALDQLGYGQSSNTFWKYLLVFSGCLNIIFVFVFIKKSKTQRQDPLRTAS